MSNHRGFPRSVFKSGLAGLLAVFLFTLSPPGRSAAVVSTPGGIGAAYVPPPPDIAVTFRFAIIDLADTTPGQDLWEYSYEVSGLTLTTGQGFTIFFDLNRYTLLQDPPPFVNSDWDLLTVQPDLALHSNGFYVAQASRNNPSFADPFKLRFVWLGTGTPGSQPFTVYNADFSTQSQGQTTNVPEPTALALLLATLGMFARRKRKVGQPPRLSEVRAAASAAQRQAGRPPDESQPGRAAPLSLTTR